MMFRQQLKVVFTLSHFGTEGEANIPPAQVSAVPDSNGALPEGFALWQSAAGPRGTTYIVTALWREKSRGMGFSPREQSLGRIQIGDADSYNFAEMLDATPPDVPAGEGRWTPSTDGPWYRTAIYAPGDLGAEIGSAAPVEIAAPVTLVAVEAGCSYFAVIQSMLGGNTGAAIGMGYNLPVGVRRVSARPWLVLIIGAECLRLAASPCFHCIGLPRSFRYCRRRQL